MPDLTYSISLAVQGALASLDRLDMKLKRAGTSFMEIGMHGMMASMALGAGAAAITAAFGVSVKKFAEFDQQMRYVNSIAKKNEQQFKAMSNEVLDLSSALAKPAPEVAAGMYQVLSSGFDDATDALKILNIAGQAAIAGNTEMSESVKVITGAMNAYGLSADQARRVSDILFKTVEIGVVEFPELAQSLGEVTAISGQLEIPLEEVGAAISALTVTGQPAAIAMTALQNALSNYLKPTSEASKLAEELGLDLSAAHLKAVGFVKALEELVIATKGDAQAIATLFGGIRELRAILPLTGKAADELADALDKIKNSAGTTADVVAEQRKGLALQFRAMATQISNLAIRVGSDLAPAFAIMTKAFSAFASVLKAMPAVVRVVLEVLGLFTAGILAAASSALLLMPQIEIAIKLYPILAEKINLAVAALARFYANFGSVAASFIRTHPWIVAVTAALVALGATVYAVVRRYREYFEAAQKTEASTKILNKALADLRVISDSLTDAFVGLANSIRGVPMTQAGTDASVAAVKFQDLANVLKWIVEQLIYVGAGFAIVINMAKALIGVLGGVVMTLVDYGRAIAAIASPIAAIGDPQEMLRRLRAIPDAMRGIGRDVGATWKEVGSMFKEAVYGPLDAVDWALRRLRVGGSIAGATARKLGDAAASAGTGLKGMGAGAGEAAKATDEATKRLKEYEGAIRDLLRTVVYPVMPQHELEVFFEQFAPKGKIALEALVNAMQALDMIFRRLAESGQMTTIQLDAWQKLIPLIGEVTENLETRLYGASEALTLFRENLAKTGITYEQRWKQLSPLTWFERERAGLEPLMAEEQGIPWQVHRRYDLRRAQREWAQVSIPPQVWWQREQAGLEPSELPPMQIPWQAERAFRQREMARKWAGLKPGYTQWWQFAQAGVEAPEPAALEAPDEEMAKRFGLSPEVVARLWREKPQVWLELSKGVANNLQAALRDMNWQDTLKNLKTSMAATFQNALRDAIVRGGSIFENLKTAFKASFSGAFAEGLLSEGSPLKQAMTKMGETLADVGVEFGRRIMDSGLGKWFESLADKISRALQEGGMMAAMAIMGAVSILSRRGPKTLGSFVSAVGQGYVVGGALGAAAGVTFEALRGRSAVLSPAYAPTTGYPSGGTRVVSINQNNYFAHDSDPIRSAYDIGRVVESRRW